MKFVLMYVPAGLDTPLMVEVEADGVENEDIFNAMVEEIEDCTKDLEGNSQEADILKRFKGTVTAWMDTARCYTSVCNIVLNYSCDKISLYAVSGLNKEGVLSAEKL